MRKTSPLLRSGLAATLCLCALPALAQPQGDWSVGIGAHQVNPTSDNGTLAGGTLPLRIGSDIKPTVTFEYFVRQNLGIEVLAALPFKHDIAVKGVGRVGSTRQLPPVVSLQYHFNSAGKLSPFVGAGLNYTTFFSEHTSGALAGTRLTLEDSRGLAAHVGVDIALTDSSALRVDLRWADIDSKVKVNGASMGTANIDPLVYGLAYVMKF
ncbi:OmpW/AlkL family protein [Xanthomonas translucens]|uniref:OmpW/AlkL family protein n=1 Tax=Xanthomonas campestris pv. translucens TaxID=343 RepID=UPI001F60F355|nr:OmpW family outer membrane protein [Xanthomonas translucens]UNU11726.1 OmpW family protein [Xanthomonas translucens pv. translucens]